MRKHLSLILVGFVLGVLVFGFINFDKPQNIAQSLLSGVLGVSVAYAVSYSNLLLNKLFAWKKYTGLRLLLGLILNSITAYLLILVGTWLYNMIASESSFNVAMDLETHLKLAILLFSAAVIYNIAYFAFYSYNQFANQQLQELKVERKQAELQLAILKAQLSPHFLFNCINSLSVLFHTNVKKAEEFIRAMAKSYQYTLDNYRASLITVREELQFANSYAYLQKTRFENGFELKIDLDDGHLNSWIPPMTLQILVENALKHNTVSSANPILVSIKGNARSLSVSNNKVKVQSQKPSTGIGLKNVASRYKILSNQKILVTDNQHFTVTLPILNNE